jgi:hypothetical protein
MAGSLGLNQYYVRYRLYAHIYIYIYDIALLNMGFGPIFRQQSAGFNRTDRLPIISDGPVSLTVPDLTSNIVHQKLIKYINSNCLKRRAQPSPKMCTRTSKISQIMKNVQNIFPFHAGLIYVYVSTHRGRSYSQCLRDGVNHLISPSRHSTVHVHTFLAHNREIQSMFACSHPGRGPRGKS